MRIIKFRAWDKHIEEMKQPISPLHTGDYLTDKDVIVMQYTGLKDKNGVEIYEGDIVRENTELGISNIHYEVGFERGHFTLTDRKSGYDRMGIWNVNTNMEIIGNIYENPELLNK